MATAKIATGVYANLRFELAADFAPFGQTDFPNEEMVAVLQPDDTYMTLREISFSTEMDTYDRSNAFSYTKMISPALLTGECSFNGFEPVTGNMNLIVGQRYKCYLDYNEPPHPAWGITFGFLLTKVDRSLVVDGAIAITLSGSIFPIEGSTIEGGFRIPRIKKVTEDAADRSFRPFYPASDLNPIPNPYIA